MCSGGATMGGVRVGKEKGISCIGKGVGCDKNI